MNCETCQHHLTDLLWHSKALPSEAQIHLESCAECKSFQADLQAILQGLQWSEQKTEQWTEGKEAEVPVQLKARVMQQATRPLSCEQAQSLLLEPGEGLSSGALNRLNEHVQGCADCQAYRQDLERIKTALVHAAPAKMPPAELKDRIMGQIKRPSSSQRAWWGVGMAATVAAVLWVGSLLTPSATAKLAPSPSVVVGAGGAVVFANNNLNAPVVMLGPDGEVFRLSMDVTSVPYFTEAVAEGDRVYLLDTANQLLSVINVKTRALERTHSIHSGASGLSVQQGRIFVKCALSGYLTSIGKDGYITEIQLGDSSNIPREAFMDAVLAVQDRLLVTHHTSGKVFEVNPQTLKVTQTFKVGGEPVALNRYRQSVLILDHQGRLLELKNGKVQRSLKLPGHPDKMTVASNAVYLSDRKGEVMTIDLERWKVVQQKAFAHPMDLTTLPDGSLAVADLDGGIKMLNRNLEVQEEIL